LEVRDAAIGIETLWVNRRSSRVPELGGLLSVLGVSSWAGPIALYTNLTVSGGDMTFSGPISGPGDLRLIFNDRVQLTGAEPNTYTGDTLADAVLLELNKPSGITAFRGRLMVDSGSGAPSEVRWRQDFQCIGADVTLFPGALVNLNNHREEFGPVTFHGGTIATGAGEIGIYGLVTVNPSSDTAFILGRLGLPAGVREYQVSDGGPFPDLWIDATVVGPGGLRKTGAGQMWLAASNSYEGLTTVAEGALSVLNPFGLGAIGAGTTVDDGATLELNFTGAPMPEALAIRGTGLNGNGALGGFGDVTLRPTFPSIYAAIDLTTNATIAVAAGARLTVDGFISGIGPLTKAGRGTLVLANSNPNTYSGDTIVADGVLNLSKPNSAVSVPGDLIVGPAPLNSLAIARWSTPGGMNPGSIATINASSLLDLNGNDQTLSRLNLNDGGDVQTGAGRLSFPAGAVVNVGSQSPLGSHEGSTISGNIGLAPNSTLTFAVSAFAPTPPFYFGPELDVNAAIPAPADNLLRDGAGLTKSGAGRMRLFGNNSFRGWVNIGEGALTAGNSTALGAVFFRSGTYVFNSGTLQLEGGVNIEGENLVLNSTATPALEGLFGESYWSGQVTLSRDSSIGADPGSVLHLAGIIAGTGSLTKLGAGTLRFGGGNANTYSGETSINEGTLLLSKPHGIAAVPGSLSIGTPAGLPAAAVNLTSYQVLGNIFVNRGGLLNVNDQVENVDHLWLTEGGDVQTTTGILFLKSGGSIQVVPGAVADSSTIAGNLDMDVGTHVINVGSGTRTGAPDLEITALVTSSLGPVTPRKYGPGTLRLAANNTYSGTTVVDEGVLRVDGVQPQSPVQVNAAGTLQGTGVLGSIGYGGNGVVAPGASPGILTCNNLLNTSGSGILEIELTGPAPGANGYDRLNVNGIVTLSGITLRVRANFIANTNQQFVLIDNQSANAVGGTFIGLAQNADVVAGDQIFRISYFGRDGNDVVLTKIADVFRPVLSIERIGSSSVRLTWPASFAGYTLQSTTNLSATNWTAALPLPAINGTSHVVTNAAGDVRRFYRLAK
jgi:autotransporter-associated beta strand protein